MNQREWGFLLLGLTSLDLFNTYMLARGFLVPHEILTGFVHYLTSPLQIILTLGIFVYAFYLINKK